jgi:multiple sugar transport system substrate-binding protein
MTALHRLFRRPRAGLAVGAALLGLVLTSCSGGTSVGGDAPTGAEGANAGKGDVTGEIRLSFWGSGVRVEKTNGVSDLFVKANPGVKVTPNYTDFAAYFQKLNVEASSGNLACVMQLQGRQLNDYASKDLLLDLQPMIDSGAIDVANIPAEVLDTGRGTDGKLYEIPYGAAYDSVMINTTLAEEAGVGQPAKGYTWDDFVAYIKNAGPKLPNGIVPVNLGGGLPNYFIEWTRANGKDMFTDDGKAAFSAEDLAMFWTMWEDLRKADLTTTAQNKAAEAPQTEQSNLATGKVLLDNKPGNQLGQAQGALEGAKPGQELTTIQLPGGANGASGTVLFTSGWSIPKNCTNIPTAAAYINFWINDHEANTLFASNNGAVTNTKELEAQLADPSLDKATKHALQLYQEIVANKPPTVLYPAGYQANFETAFTRSYQDISLNGADIQETARTFIDNLNSALEAAK